MLVFRRIGGELRFNIIRILCRELEVRSLKIIRMIFKDENIKNLDWLLWDIGFLSMYSYR